MGEEDWWKHGTEKKSYILKGGIGLLHQTTYKDQL